jgi:Flp pilus assembly protein TadG
VEFALIFPVFLLLTVGVVDMARIFSSYISIVDGVREAALYAADGLTHNVQWCAAPAAGTIPCPTGATAANKRLDPDNIAFRIKSAGITAAQVTMDKPVCAPDPCVAGGTVKIAASYRVMVLTPILSTILGGTIDMSVATTATVIQ